MPELNVTNSLAYSMSSGSSWFSVFIIVAMASIVLSFLIMGFSSFERYKKLKGVLGWIVNSFKYFVIGCGFITLLAIPFLVLYYFIKQAREGNVAPLRYSIYIIGGYFVIAFIGWLGKKYVYDRLSKFEKKLEKKKNEKMFISNN